jgi:hypothetical protein
MRVFGLFPVWACVFKPLRSLGVSSPETLDLAFPTRLRRPRCIARLTCRFCDSSSTSLTRSLPLASRLSPLTSRKTRSDRDDAASRNAVTLNSSHLLPWAQVAVDNATDTHLTRTADLGSADLHFQSAFVGKPEIKRREKRARKFG